jgi:SAM-dependent methyltransferase
MPRGPGRALRREIAHLAGLFRGLVLYFYLPLTILLVGVHFPYDTDASLVEPRSAAPFYEAVYQPTGPARRGLDYEQTSIRAAAAANIEGRVAEFVDRHQLHDKRVLDVGSGRGYLQDIVADYTGLDLSAKVASHYHKPFVVGSATEMPFPDDSFDAIWTVWVLEHIPQPEKALAEMRRVVKPGGLLFLIVAWNCASWAADGFDARPYSDFTLAGKLIKASTVVRGSVVFDAIYRVPTRIIRWVQYTVGGARTPLRFSALQPNYEFYWQPDSDAAVSLDFVETMLWFESRGDTCLNCGSVAAELLSYVKPLVIRVET